MPGLLVVHIVAFAILMGAVPDAHPLGVGFVVMLSLIICSTIYFRVVKAICVSNDNCFKQAGVVVQYSEKIITIHGEPYGVADVRSISTEDDSNAYYVVFNVNDIKNPRKKVLFASYDSRNTFYSRIELALKKAGW